MKNRMIRLAQPSDTKAILNIYEPYIKETAITFEYDVPSIDEFRERIEQISSEYPYLVCVLDDKIIGYAYAHRQKERAAYQWNAELSIYIDQSNRRSGAGKALYGALMDILKLQNVRNVYGVVTSPNSSSEGLHAYFGFKKSGIFHNTGFKCGAWHDVLWLEKDIGSDKNEPKPFRSIKDIDENMIAEILNRHSTTNSTL